MSGVLPVELSAHLCELADAGAGDLVGAIVVRVVAAADGAEPPVIVTVSYGGDAVRDDDEAAAALLVALQRVAPLLAPLLQVRM